MRMRPRPIVGIGRLHRRHAQVQHAPVTPVQPPSPQPVPQPEPHRLGLQPEPLHPAPHRRHNRRHNRRHADHQPLPRSPSPRPRPRSQIANLEAGYRRAQAGSPGTYGGIPSPTLAPAPLTLPDESARVTLTPGGESIAGNGRPPGAGRIIGRRSTTAPSPTLAPTPPEVTGTAARVTLTPGGRLNTERPPHHVLEGARATPGTQSRKAVPPADARDSSTPAGDRQPAAPPDAPGTTGSRPAATAHPPPRPERRQRAPAHGPARRPARRPAANSARPPRVAADRDGGQDPAGATPATSATAAPAPPSRGHGTSSRASGPSHPGGCRHGDPV